MSNDQQKKSGPEGSPRNGPAAPERPVYRKPALRRYDQIEQVRPYGPSEV